MKCKVDSLEGQFDNCKKENEDIKQRLQDEKCAFTAWVSEKDVELSQLKSRIAELMMFSGCLDDCPVSFQSELELYGKLLDSHQTEFSTATGEMKEQSENKRTRTSKTSSVGLSSLTSA